MVELWFNLLKKISGIDDNAICEMGSVDLVFLILYWSSLTVTAIVALSGLLLIAVIYLWP